MEDYKGTFFVLVFYLKDLEFLVISTDSVQTHRAYIDRREEALLSPCYHASRHDWEHGKDVRVAGHQDQHCITVAYSL